MFSTNVLRLSSQLTKFSWTNGVATSMIASTCTGSRASVAASLRVSPVVVTPWPAIPGMTTRTFATSDKKTSKGKEEHADTTTTTGASPSPVSQPFLQHQEWVKFQQSIRVEGFQTGQVMAATTLTKNRGGKQARNRKVRELALMQQADPNLADSSDKFPALRYSPEETQELLKLAFETLPQKTGKRGTRNLKRQKRRWTLVREIRAKYKRQIIAAHERRMEHRQWTRQQTKAVKEMAPQVCDKDTRYQAQILQRWAATMFTPQAAAATITQVQQSE